MDPVTTQTIIQGGILITTIFIAKTVNDIKKKTSTGGSGGGTQSDPDSTKRG